MVNYYKLLKLPEAITQEEIESAFDLFKAELKKFSPGIQLSDAELRLREPEMWDAYVVLLNPGKRKEHDELLERDRVHKLYEAQNKIKEQEEVRSSAKWKYIGLGATVLIVVLYFLIGQVSSTSLPVKPKWRTHYITDEIKVLLPGDVDTTENFIATYLGSYLKKSNCSVSKIGGFSVSVAYISLNYNYKMSPKDAAYINSMEMQDPHVRFKDEDTTKINLSINEYYGQLKKGSFQVDNVVRAYENYTLMSQNDVIKVIVNYIPGNADHEKYSQIVCESLLQ